MAPVHAGWFDFLFKGAAKQAEKQIIKQEEKTVVKQAERNTIKQEEKQVTKPAQILINKEFGNALDDAFKTAWCKNYRCTTKFTDIRVNALGTDTVYIIDDYAAQKFIQRNYQLDYVSAFNRRPDMLRIKTTDGRVTSIVMYDVKTTKNAVAAAEQRGQGKDYANFCQKLNLAQGKNFCKKYRCQTMPPIPSASCYHHRPIAQSRTLAMPMQRIFQSRLCWLR